MNKTEQFKPQNNTFSVQQQVQDTSLTRKTNVQNAQYFPNGYNVQPQENIQSAHHLERGIYEQKQVYGQTGYKFPVKRLSLH